LNFSSLKQKYQNLIAESLCIFVFNASNWRELMMLTVVVVVVVAAAAAASLHTATTLDETTGISHPFLIGLIIM
jgi:hypothetical protein